MSAPALGGHPLDGVSWQQPWYQPWADTGQPVAEAWRAGATLPEALNRAAVARGVPTPLFVPQSALAPGMAYESHVASHWQCPTREGLHDFFNGLCWLQFPLSKARLNALQAEQIARDGVQARRGPVRDAITLLDESAALLLAPEPLWQALLARDWNTLFLDLRSLWVQARLVLFGHATLERLVAPRKPMVAHVYRPRVSLCDAATQAASFTQREHLDAWLAADLDAAHLASKPFAPLPLMGVPGWCADNADPAFYADAAVFRPTNRVGKA